MPGPCCCIGVASIFGPLSSECLGAHSPLRSHLRPQAPMLRCSCRAHAGASPHKTIEGMLSTRMHTWACHMRAPLALRFHTCAHAHAHALCTHFNHSHMRAHHTQHKCTQHTCVYCCTALHSHYGLITTLVRPHYRSYGNYVFCYGSGRHLR